MGRVFVTGMGVVSSLGLGREPYWESLTQGRSGISEVTLFDTSNLPRNLGGEVKGFVATDFMSEAEARRMGRCSAFAVAAARMAVEDAGIGGRALAGERTAVVVGTTMGEANVLGELQQAWIHEGTDAVRPAKLPRYGTTLLPIDVARAFGASGMVQTLPAACAAGNYSIGFAADQIRRRARGRGADRRRRDHREARVLRLRPAERDEPGPLPALRQEPKRADPRRGGHDAGPRVRGERGPPRRHAAGRGGWLRACLRRAPHHAAASRGRGQHLRHAPGD